VLGEQLLARTRKRRRKKRGVLVALVRRVPQLALLLLQYNTTLWLWWVCGWQAPQ
jgi:hypothetical protein